MATIGEEVDSTLVSTNVIEGSPVFNNTLNMNYENGYETQYGTSVYVNTGDDIVMREYNPSTEYKDGDVIYKNGVATVGVLNMYEKEVQDYTKIQKDFNPALWDSRYLLFSKKSDAPSSNGITIGLNTYHVSDFCIDKSGTRLYTKTYVSSTVTTVTQYISPTGKIDLSNLIELNSVDLPLESLVYGWSIQISETGDRLIIQGVNLSSNQLLSIPFLLGNEFDLLSLDTINSSVMGDKGAQ